MKQSLHNSKLTPAQGWACWLPKIVACMALWMVAQVAIAQTPDCNTIMACNDGVQVSVDEFCTAVITPDVVLEAMQYDNSFYAVELRDQNGVALSSNVLNGSHIGDTIEVKVTLIGCSLSCWGHIVVEDKLPPVFAPCDTVRVQCETDTDVGAPGIPSPLATDACGGTITYTHADNRTVMACGTPYSEMIVRRWVAADPSGNTDSCSQVILVRKAELADVVFPPSYDDLPGNEPSFTCDNNLIFDEDGTPSPNSTGFPTGVECNNIQYYYTDVVFDLCGASLKVVRQWVIIDWCTGAERTNFQTIKIVDDVAPVCAGTGDSQFINIPTDEGVCTGTFDVPPPTVVFECSSWTYNVGYKLRDEDGQPFVDQIFDNVVDNGDGSFSITDLPMDTTWVVYNITDDCGNQTMCFIEVVVDDEEAPSPICEGFTNISLDQVGWADLFAESVDDHSYDNCAIDRFEVRRETTPCGFSDDLMFGEKVNFCCSDIANNPIRVIMRVYDESGNFNDCVVNVTVQDKMAPEIITCPPNVQLQCEQDPRDTMLTGGEDLVVASDNCNLTITSSIRGSVGSCGTGTLTRTWVVTDPQGRTDECRQTITVVDSDPFDGTDISWPGNVLDLACTVSDLTPEELDSKPTLTNTDCADLAMSYDDETFYNAPDACVKIIRHWRVVDWCAGSSSNPVFYEYDQKIEIKNSDAPTFESGCTDQTINPEPGNCDGEVTVAITASDDCTPSSDLDYSYTIDADSNGSIDITGTGSTWTRVLPAGTHTVTYTVVDGCDKEETCTFTVRVIDNKAPQPICLGQVTWGMGEDGRTEIWASDFNLKSTDECSADSLLRYSFNEQGTQPALELTCDDLVDGVGSVIELEVYVLDPDGNVSFCVVELFLQDNQRYCADLGTRTALGGYITNIAGGGIQDIEVELVNTTMNEETMSMTKEQGDYMFDEVNYYDGYEVAPYKNDDTDNGVSTLDLVLIQRHILDVQPLEDPRQQIAADINNNKSITGADVVELRSLILGKTSEFGNNTSWRFVDASHDWDEWNFAFDFPEAIHLEEVYHQKMDANFDGIKIGDVNGSASIDGLGGRSAATVSLVVDDVAFDAGDLVRIDVKAGDQEDLLGLQMALDLGDLSYESVEGIRGDQVRVDGGVLLVALDAAMGMSLVPNQTVFTIVARATSTGTIADQIAINDKVALSTEAYDMDANVADINLELRGAGARAEAVVLEQNTPNPWGDNTIITYSIPVDGDVVLTMYDLAGRQVYRAQQYVGAGTHSIAVTKDQIGASGVIYYRLDAAGASITKKMILID